jgi:hypothetical protein
MGNSFRGARAAGIGRWRAGYEAEWKEVAPNRGSKTVDRDW